MIVKKEQFIYFCFIYILFMPTAAWFGGFQTGVMFLLLMLLLYVVFFPFYKIIINMKYLLTISLLFIPIAISLSANYVHITVNDSFEFIRIFIYIIIFVVAYNIGKNTRYESIVKIVKVFLVFELFFVIIQRFEITPIVSLLQLIWDNEKNWAYRNTGSFSNPNTLAFFVILAVIIVLVGDLSKKSKFLYSLLAFIIIIFTGSRTGIIAFMSLFPLAIVNLKKMDAAVVGRVISLFFLIVLIFYFTMQFYGEQNKYMFELLKVLEHGELGSVETFSERTNVWKNVLLKLDDFAYFFGLGPGKEIGLKYVDNEYLATFSKYGIFGIIIKIFVYSYMGYRANKLKILHYTKILNLYLLLLLIYGITVETFTSWSLMLLFFMFFGILISKSNCRHFAKQEVLSCKR